VEVSNPSCDLYQPANAKGQHEQEDLQFEPASGHGVNRLWKHAFNVTEGCLDMLSIDLLQVLNRNGDCYDNAMAESFFATLECELIEQESFSDRS
jgi:hypothetical protein